jgi:hypothetical protein
MKNAPKNLITGEKGHVPNKLLSQNIKLASTTCDTSDQTCDTSNHQKKGLQDVHTASSAIPFLQLKKNNSQMLWKTFNWISTKFWLSLAH